MVKQTARKTEGGSKRYKSQSGGQKRDNSPGPVGDVEAEYATLHEDLGQLMRKAGTPLDTTKRAAIPVGKDGWNEGDILKAQEAVQEKGQGTGSGAQHGGWRGARRCREQGRHAGRGTRNKRGGHRR